MKEGNHGFRGDAWTLSAARLLLGSAEARWRALSVEGSLPRRRDLDAEHLGDALPQAFMLEEVATGAARIRVAGQTIHEWFGDDPKGAPLPLLFQDSSRPALRAPVEAAFGRPALVELAIEAPRGLAGRSVRGRLLLLPLLDDSGLPTRALGLVGLASAPSPGPLRLSLVGRPYRIEALPGARRFIPIRTVAAEAGAPSGLAEGRAPWLRLVVSND